MRINNHLQRSGIVLLLIMSVLLSACTVQSSPEIPATATPGSKSISSPAPSPSPEAPTAIPTATESATGLPAAPNNPSTDDNPYAPRPSDAAWSTGPVFLEETGVSAEPAGSSQYQLFLSGSLPTPCHELRVKIEPPDAQLRIQVEVYSVVDPNMMCTQVLKAFEAAIPLNVSDSGNYTVWVNGDQAGSLTIP